MKYKYKDRIEEAHYEHMFRQVDEISDDTMAFGQFMDFMRLIKMRITIFKIKSMFWIRDNYIGTKLFELYVKLFITRRKNI